MTAQLLSSGADAFTRRVYCVLGMPIDAVRIDQALSEVDRSIQQRRRLLLSTPNLNFLANSENDDAFLDSLYASDLCTADGSAIVLVARLLGIPVPERVAGSDLFTALKTAPAHGPPVRVFLFGGAPGVAELAAQRIDAFNPKRMRCVGTLDPGFVSVEAMSRSDIIDTINASNADFLFVSLGAAKGQAWLMRNSDRLEIPVRVHLGAALNFEANTISRAPAVARRFGLEWAWRIKEEPHLWRRYAHDGRVLARLLATRIVPLALLRLSRRGAHGPLSFDLTTSPNLVTIHLRGAATESNAATVSAAFRQAVGFGTAVVIDGSGLTALDARFLGQCLVLHQQVAGRLRMIGLPSGLQRLVRLHGARQLISD